MNVIEELKKTVTNIQTSKQSKHSDQLAHLQH